jgi:hypothetical protein
MAHNIEQANAIVFQSIRNKYLKEEVERLTKVQCRDYLRERYDEIERAWKDKVSKKTKK